MSTTPDAYARTTFRGKTVDEATKAAGMAMEEILGYELTIVQGSFNDGVRQSAGTHNQGRVIDLAAYDWQRKVAAARRVGFAAYHRTRIPGVWEEHIHIVLILNSWDNNKGIAPAAFDQIGDYRHGRDGLAQHGPDRDWRPTPLHVFQYPPKEKPVPVFRNNMTEAKDAGVEASQFLGVMATKLEAAASNRPTAAGKVFCSTTALGVRGLRRSLLAYISRLPSA